MFDNIYISCTHKTHLVFIIMWQVGTSDNVDYSLPNDYLGEYILWCPFNKFADLLVRESVFEMQSENIHHGLISTQIY